MRSIKAAILSIMIICTSCSNELDTIIFSDPTPVVYGIICPHDSIHRVRLMRSFISEGNIAQYAKLQDSIFFGSAQVFLETRTPKGDIVQRIEMFREELPEREPGLFLSSPNLVYQCFSKDLIKPLQNLQDLRYVLTVYIEDQEKALVAESLIPPLPSNTKPLHENPPFALNLYGDYEPIKFSWRRSLDFYVEFETRINYTELKNGEWHDSFVTHSRKFNHWDTPPKNPFEEIIINGDWFFPMLGGRIKDDMAVGSRKFISIDFTLKTSDPLFYDYFAYGHYLTDLSANTFTNVTNGIGIFAAYNKTEWQGYTLTQGSMDSLALGKYTKHLKFTRWQ